SRVRGGEGIPGGGGGRGLATGDRAVGSGGSPRGRTGPRVESGSGGAVAWPVGAHRGDGRGPQARGPADACRGGPPSHSAGPGPDRTGSLGSPPARRGSTSRIGGGHGPVQVDGPRPGEALRPAVRGVACRCGRHPSAPHVEQAAGGQPSIRTPRSSCGGGDRRFPSPRAPIGRPRAWHPSWDMSREGAGQIRGLVVAIDGPAGVGKSTLARALARELRLPYINTGLMYRALAGRSREAGVHPGDEARLAELARAMTFALDEGDPPELSIDGQAPAASLSEPEVEAVVSEVARHPSVRALMRAAQRELGLGGSVMEGRDIGTVVFPDAPVKIFLSAPERVRAGRRVAERGGGADIA